MKKLIFILTITLSLASFSKVNNPELHTHKSTIDLTLLDKQSGKELDMGWVFDYFGELSHPDYEAITDGQKANRLLLRNAMLSNGFEPYPNTYFDFPICYNN